MDLLDGIKERRSIRKFTDQKIALEDIKSIVETSRFSPSWKNTQTARYNLIINEDIKRQIAAEGTDFEWNKNIINGAPALVIITTIDKRSGFEKDGSFSTSKGVHWQSFDAGLAVEAFCLAAHAHGLGTVILGIFDEAKVAKIINLPDTEKVSAIIPIGYPAEQPETKPRKDVDEVLRVI